MSLNGKNDDVVNSVVKSMTSQGISIVVSAGNNGQSACNFSPSSSASAIVVGAIDMSDSLLDAPASNYGPCVTIYAP